MPQLLNHLDQDELDPDSLDWGTLAVYTCPDSCNTTRAQEQTGSAYVEEFVWVQLQPPE
jgi:pre-rRNA-processing protein TSR4